MAWVKAAASCGDDVFDEDGDELNLQRKEWASSMKKRIRDGYVDGVDAGEEASLQVGFNLGFREGAARSRAVGRLRGVISAIWCWCQMEHPEKPIPASVVNLLQQVSQHEDRIVDKIRRELENPPPSVTDVSESFEVLEVDQATTGDCGGDCAGGCAEKDCCRGGEKMDSDSSQQPRRQSSVSSGCSSSSADADLSFLMQRCIEVVLELNLPQELVRHIEELGNLERRTEDQSTF